MNTIILAAGEGTRLRPHTLNKPKCMVELFGKPLLHHQMDVICQCGISDEIIIVGGYCPERIEPRSAKIVVNTEYNTSNMVTSLFCARDHIRPDEELLICYGDIIFEPRILNKLLQDKAPISVAADTGWKTLWQLRNEDPLQDAETFVMDHDQNVVELGRKPQSYDRINAQYMGLIHVAAECVGDLLDAYDKMDRDRLYEGKAFKDMYMTAFLQYLIDSGWPVHASLTQHGWLEVDTVDDLDLYHGLSQTKGLSALYDSSTLINNA